MGNLKVGLTRYRNGACTLIRPQSHQNKFHAATLRNLTMKFASMHEGDTISAADKDLWEYFATVYKNSNKGIKGRGKDRRIFSVTQGRGEIKQEASSRGSSSSSSSDKPPRLLNGSRRQSTGSLISMSRTSTACQVAGQGSRMREERYHETRSRLKDGRWGWRYWMCVWPVG